MPTYIFQLIDRDGFEVGPPTCADYESPIAAVAHGRRMLQEGDVEIRNGKQLVAYLVADRAAMDERLGDQP